MTDEKDIVKGLKAANWKSQNKCLKILYERYYSDLYRFVWQYVKSSETANEIVHDAFVRLWFHRNNLDENKSVKAYLFTISKNSLIKETRRQIKNPLQREFIEFINSISVESRISYDYDVFTNAIKQAKEELTPRQCEIFQMNKEDDISVKDIAEMLSITEQVVRNQLSKAMKIVREYLLDHVKPE